MKVTLFDFQKDALGKLRDALVSARKSVSPDNQQVVAFSAATGSGKTIMMTALFGLLVVLVMAVPDMVPLMFDRYWMRAWCVVLDAAHAALLAAVFVVSGEPPPALSIAVREVAFLAFLYFAACCPPAPPRRRRAVRPALSGGGA